MKNTLRIWLIALLLPLVTLGQKLEVIGRVDMSGYYTKGQTDSLIKAKMSGSTDLPPVVIKLPCTEGPTINAITAITPGQITGWFHGVDVFGINWKISRSKTDTIGIRRGSVAPQDNHPVLNFSPLDPGQYVLWYTGSTCRGESNRAFTLEGSTGGGVVNPPIEQGGVFPVSISQSIPDHMKISIAKSSDGWIINDETTLPPSPGYDFWYQVNGQIIKLTKSLKDYTYNSNWPIRIVKMQGRKGLDTFNRWESWDDGYYSTKAGEVFSYNTTAPFYTGIFKNAKSNFVNPLPATYDPLKRQSQWADLGQPFKLPKGHIFVVNRNEWSIQSQLEQGVTHISHFQLPWDNPTELNRLRSSGVTYSDVQRPENFLNITPVGEDDWSQGFNKKYWPTGELTEKEAIDGANRQFLHALTVNETEEGSSYMPKDRAMWGYFYRRMRERQIEEFDSKGIPSYLCHNYFSLGLPFLNHNNSREEAKKTGLNPNRDGAYNVWVSGSLKDNNLICIAVYMSAPDLHIGSVYNNIYQMLNNSKIGQHSAGFPTGRHEWRPNNPQRISYPDGEYYQSEKMPVDPNTLVSNVFAFNEWGIGVIEWGEQGKVSSRKVDVVNRPGLWFPTGATSPQGGFPYASNGGISYDPYTGAVDLCAFASKLYNDTFGQVKGGDARYLSFRIDDGQWNNPSQQGADEVVDAFYDKRGLAYARVRDGKTAWLYMNPFADNMAHKLEVVLPDGRSITETVASNAIHVKLQ